MLAEHLQKETLTREKIFSMLDVKPEEMFVINAPQTGIDRRIGKITKDLRLFLNIKFMLGAWEEQEEVFGDAVIYKILRGDYSIEKIKRCECCGQVINEFKGAR